MKEACAVRGSKPCGMYSRKHCAISVFFLYAECSLQYETQTVNCMLYDTGCLPQKVTNERILVKRQAEIERNHSIFEWMSKPESGHISYGLPRHLPAARVDDLPLLLKWNDKKVENYENGTSISSDLVARNIQGGIIWLVQNGNRKCLNFK